MTMRQLGVPLHHELAMGAIASAGVRVLNRTVVGLHGLDEATLNEVAQRELKELQRRERGYRADRPSPQLREQDHR